MSFRLTASRKVLETAVFDVHQERAEHPSGVVLERAVTINPPSVVILAKDDEGRILTVRQYRLPIRDELEELPAGRRDQGEPPLAAAQRELREETGYRAGRWRELLEFYPAPGFASERMTAFLAEDLTPGDPQPEPYERIAIRWRTKQELWAMTEKRELTDAKTLLTLLWAERAALI